MAQKEVGKTIPREVHCYHYSPHKTVFLGSVKLKDVPGALSKVATLVAGMGLDLIESNSFSIADSATAEWGFFAEADNGNVSSDDVEAAIEKLPDVVDIRVKGAEGRIVVDNFHYPLTLTAGAPAMLIRREVFTDTLKFMIKTYGSAGASLIYQLGKAAPKASSRKWG